MDFTVLCRGYKNTKNILIYKAETKKFLKNISFFM